jgi:hypothetical protein
MTIKKERIIFHSQYQEKAVRLAPLLLSILPLYQMIFKISKRGEDLKKQMGEGSLFSLSLLV